MGWLQKISQSAEGIMLISVMTMIATNLVLTGTSKVLGYLKDKTATQLDNKAFEVINRLLGALHKAIDYVSANASHLPPKVVDELKQAQDAGLVEKK